MRILNKVKSGATNVLNSGKKMASSVIDAGKDTIASAIDSSKEKIASVIDAGKEAISPIVDSDEDTIDSDEETVAYTIDSDKKTISPFDTSKIFQQFGVKQLKAILETLKTLKKTEPEVTIVIDLVENLIETITEYQNSKEKYRKRKLLQSLAGLKHLFDIKIVIVVLGMFQSVIPYSKMLILVLKRLA
jgi:hypothetical protein